MTETTKLSSLKYDDIFTKKNELLYPFIKLFAKGIVAFVLSGYSIGGEIYPFGIAYTLICKGNQTIPIAIFSALGYWVMCKEFPLKYLAALILGTTFKWCFLMGKKTDEKYLPFLSLFSIAVPSFCITLFIDYNIYNIVLSITETILAFCGSYFFLKATQSYSKSKTYISKKDTIASIFLICILIAAFSNIKILNLNVGIIISTLLLNATSFIMGENGGTILGASLGAAYVIMDGNLVFLPLCYSLGGLIGGLFKPLGKLSVAISFILTSTFFVLISNSQDKIYIILEFLIGCLIFVLLPSDIIKKIVPLSQTTPTDQTLALCNVLKNKLFDCSNAIGEIKKTTDEVSFVTEKHSADNTEMIYTHVCDKICKYCPSNLTCWQDNYSSTIDIFNHVIDDLKFKKNYNPNDFPTYFKDTCSYYCDIGEEISNGYHNYIQNLRTKRQLARLRWVVTDQLDGISMMIKNIATNIDGLYHVDDVIAGKIDSYFNHKKTPPLECICYINKFDRIIIEVTIPKLKLARIDNTNTVLDLSDICDRELDMPIITKSEETATLKYTELANLKVDFGFFQKAALDNTICGDNCRQLREKDGMAYVILSDGMGTGKNAAIESAMTIDMLYDLLNSGCDYESALKLVNSSLICKSPVECFATVDISSLDLYSGEITFFKAACAPTYVLKNNKVSKIITKSLPVGILQDISPSKFTVKLWNNDIVLNISDGLIATGDDWITSELLSVQNKSPQEIAEHLYSVAMARNIKGREDDMTVSVMKITNT